MIWKITIRSLLGNLEHIPFQQVKLGSLHKMGLLLCIYLFSNTSLLGQQDDFIPILDPPGRFEIDGNLTAGDVPDGIDWAPEFKNGVYLTSANNYIFNPQNGTAVDPNTSVFVTDPLESSTDDVFSGGDKYTQDPTEWRSKMAGASPGKGDMSTAFYHISRDANGDQWLFVGSDRLKNNGTSYIDFEFFQGGVFHNPSTNRFTTTNANGKARSEGDFLISVKYSNGGSDASIQFFIWENNQFVEYTSSIGVGDAVANGNTTEVRRPFTGSNAAVYDSYLFVEAGLNMTKIFNDAAGDLCDDIELESLLVKTKTSTSDNAQLIDFIGPVPVDIFFGAARITYDPNPVCEGYSQFYEPSIEGVQNGTFSASPGGLVINSDTGVIDVAASNPGTYTITYTFDSYGCNDLTSDYDVTIQALPANPGTTSAYNNGDFTQCFTGQTLNANSAIEPVNGVSIVWYTSAGGDTTTSSPTLSSPGTVSYWAQAVLDDGGCESPGRTEVILQLKDKPEANDDSATTNEDQPISIDVIANDTDLENDPLVITGVTQPANGTAQIIDNKITYTPNADFSGQNTFTYTVSDENCGTDTATVTVNVSPVNDAPVAVDDSSSTNEDTQVLVDVLANDTDVDGDNLSITEVSDPPNGSAVISNGKVLYTPDADFNGVDTFTYTISDGNGGTDSATVTITVNPINDAPVAEDDSAETNEDTAVVIDVLANDSDVDLDILNITNVSDPPKGTASITNGKITYTPDANFNGVDSFTYTISDGKGGTDTATVTVTVNPINDAPVAVDDAASTNEDIPVLVNVLANDSDVDGDNLTITSVSDPANGTAAISNGQVNYTPDANFNGEDSFTYIISDGNGGTDSATVTVTVNPVNDAPVAVNDVATTNEDTAVLIDVLDNDSDVDMDALTIATVSDPPNGTASIVNGQVNYMPDEDFNGEDSFTYTISDGKGGTDTATVTVTVIPINDDPVAVDDIASTEEDTEVIIDVLANDSDVDGDNLSITEVSDPPNGTAVIVNGEVSYTPDNNYNGMDSFTYTISDGNGGTDTATVQVFIGIVNDPPVAVDDEVITDEDTPINIDVLANDSDIDGDDLTIINVTNPPKGTATINNGEITYTPDLNFNGEDSFQYTISDGMGGTDTATVTVTVNAINDAPVAVDDSASTPEDQDVLINVLANDSDVDGDNLSISTVSDPPNGTATITNGQINYMPDEDFNGVDTFTYTISDGQGGTDSATVTVTVSPINDAPVAVDDEISTNEDTAVLIDVLANDSDVDQDNLTITIVSDPDNGTAEITNGKVTYTPDPDFNGTDSFTYSISDGKGGTDSATVTVTVIPVNDAPVAVDDAVSTDEDMAVEIDVLANDSDVDEDVLVISEVSQPDNGTAEINNGKIIYTPDPNFNGEDTFTYTISDNNGGTDTATVTVTVNPVNDQPVAQDDEIATNEDTPVVIDVLANDSDDDEDVLSISNLSDPPNGTAVITNGQVTYTPDPDFNGTDSFTYSISDGKGGTDTATVTVTVNPINDDPVAVDDAVITDEDNDIVIDVLANDSDVDQDNISITSHSSPSNGTAEITNGSITYTPNPNYNGEDSFTYTISDGNGGTDTATVTITVNPVNDEPVANDDIAVTEEDTPVNIPVLDNDEDIDGDELLVESVSDPANGTTSINEDGSIRYTPDPGFTGEDTFTYTVTDGNGGSDTGSVTVYVSDESGPEIVCPDPVILENDESICGAVYEFSLPEFSDNSGVATIVQIGGPASGDTFPVGKTTLIFRATDNAGNFSICSYDVTVLDTEAPEITQCAADLLTVEADQGACSATEIDLGMPEATDNCTPSDELTITNDAPAEFPLGETIVTWTITDKANNETSCTQRVIVTDSQAPVITECAADLLNVETDLDACSATEIDLGMPSATDNCTPSDELTITNDAPAEFPLGETIVTWTIADAAGNEATCTQRVMVNDIQAPVITECAADLMNVEANLNGCAASGLDLGMPTATDNCSGSGDLTFTNDAPEEFPLGETIVTWTVTDAAGNETSCTQSVMVNDSQAPVITECAPETIEVSTDEGLCSASGVELGMPVASDNCNGELSITNDAPDVFQLGNTTVTWTIRDNAGNTSTCTQTVIVRDDQAPTLESLDDIIVANEPGNCGAVVTYGMLGASDNCELDSVVLTEGLESGSEFPVGTTTVTYTATDMAGNTTTSSFTVTVEDTEAPVIECPQNIEMVVEIGTTSVIVEYEAISITENCEGTTVERISGFASGEEFPLGDTTVTYTVTDAAGNTTECSFTVTVEEEPLPDPPVAPTASVTTAATCAQPTGTISVETQEGLTYSIDGETYQESGLFENLEPGTYEVTARDEFGQVSAATSVTIDEPVAEEIQTTTVDLCIEDMTFNLFDLFVGEFDDTGTWEDTDNTGALADGFIDPSMMDLGSFTFTYVVEGNCPSTTQVSVSINDDCVVLDCSLEDLRAAISKAVTPNGDNRNDFFTVDLDSGCGFSYDLMIFNRWGAKVFEARNYANNWDGYSDSSVLGSNQLPSGTYYYILQVRNSSFEPIKGYIYLGTK